ncbi:PsiF family protein [Stenotrophomonas maltophilia]|uniref:PsiF family protein n=1 Tax=Stenotrophomonas maltophilia TaxID=40324 RepID=UPI0013DAC36E|nr:PsiF family protein [Stenotrophomonas maltophilia]
MKASLLLAAALLIGLPLAAAATPQQQRMADCSAKNKGLKGDAYKTAQSACLSGHATDTKAATPQERMKQCNADAATKKLAGDARKTFMSSCLKAS